MDEQGTDTEQQTGNKKRLSTRLKVLACVGFLIFSVLLWIISERSWFLWLLLAIPCFLCEEWLAEKVNTENSGWSTAEAGLSIWRILYGVSLVLLVSAVIVGLVVIARQIF